MQKDQIKILKVRIDRITSNEAIKKIFTWLKEDQKRHITTPNPEIILKAQDNHKYLTILNRADLNIADGTGLLWAAHYENSIRNNYSKTAKTFKAFYGLILALLNPKKLRVILPERVTGIDFMEEICNHGASKKLKIFLLGAKDGVAHKTKEILESKHQGLNIVGSHSGSPSIEDENSIVEKINNANPDILFVAYGAPNQEIWINRNLDKLKSTKIAMGVGGAFDFISGEKKRAPKIMQRMGLEWLYRLIKEPTRKNRIYNATIKFPTLIIRKSLKS